jgi:hypothetical protein
MLNKENHGLNDSDDSQCISFQESTPPPTIPLAKHNSPKPTSAKPLPDKLTEATSCTDESSKQRWTGESGSPEWKISLPSDEALQQFICAEYHPSLFLVSLVTHRDFFEGGGNFLDLVLN